jgi:hypothetical protein
MRKLRERVTAKRSRIVLVVAVAAAVGAVAGVTVVAATGASHPRPKALNRPGAARTLVDVRLARVLKLKPAHSWRVGVWRDAARVKRTLVLTSSPGGSLSPASATETICLVFDLGTGASGLGCNPASDFFQGRSVVWTKASLGGPRLQSMTHLFVAGVVASSVSRVEVVDSAGARHAAPINGDGAFMFEMPRSALAEGIGPITLNTYSADGTPLDRLDL